MNTEQPVQAQPDIDFKKPHINVCDRERPHVRYQQGPALYDRKGHFVEMAAIPIYLPEPKKPEVKERDITQRTIGRSNKSVVGKITETVARAVGAAPSEKAVQKVIGRVRRDAQNPIPDSISKALQENRRAAAAEQAV